MTLDRIGLIMFGILVNIQGGALLILWYRMSKAEKYITFINTQHNKLQVDFMFHRKGKFEHGHKVLQLQIDKLRSVVFDEEGNVSVVNERPASAWAQDDIQAWPVEDSALRSIHDPESFKVVNPKIEK